MRGMVEGAATRAGAGCSARLAHGAKASTLRLASPPPPPSAVPLPRFTGEDLILNPNSYSGAFRTSSKCRSCSRCRRRFFAAMTVPLSSPPNRKIAARM